MISCNTCIDDLEWSKLLCVFLLDALVDCRVLQIHWHLSSVILFFDFQLNTKNHNIVMYKNETPNIMSFKNRSISSPRSG